ncbi:MAG: DUF4080 domain-containing protein [Clostridia bacterium]|nr:DUF4080 domain-containing protein [Clostridia bacterium]
MKKKNITLCAVNSKYIHSCPAVYYLKSAVDKALPDYNTTIIESSVNDTAEHILYTIFKTDPDIIGFSVYIWNVTMIANLCKSIKAINPDIKIILGGPEVSYGIEHTNLKIEDFDLIVSGEGENAFPAAVSIVCNEVPSTDYEISGKTISSTQIKNLDAIPFIYNDENITSFKNRIIYYETSRGCPFSCAYCLSSVCGKVRFLSLKRVFSDIDFFIRHDVQQVKFVDRTFNCNPKRATEIWKYIIDNAHKSRTNFHFEIGADLLTDTQIELLKCAPTGKIQLEIGIQSTNEKSLKESCRYAPNEKIFKNVSSLCEAGNINLHTDLIAGLPYESYERFQQSFNDVYKLKAHQLQLGFLKLLSGAPLNEIKEKHNYIFTPYPPYEILSNKYISYQKIQQLKEVEDALEKIYNSGRFVLTLNELEKVFDSPFKMFSKIADFLKENKLLFCGVSTKKLYDVLNEFSQKYKLDLSEILLQDFYLSENSEVVPDSLKHLAGLSKFTRPASSKILHQINLSKEKKIFVKFIHNHALVINYGTRNPVNGRFELICKKEIDFDE